MTTEILHETERFTNEINSKIPHIISGARIFQAKIDHLTIIIRGSKNGENINEVLDFRIHQEKPFEFTQFINDYTTRLIAEKTILQHQLSELQKRIQVFEGERHAKPDTVENTMYSAAEQKADHESSEIENWENRNEKFSG